ncbi:MAG: hypothetical protein V3S24_13015, partial [Candidatus Tectomicrobia bacterium]
MKVHPFFLISCLWLCLATVASGESEKQRIFVVSSYHKGYLWSQSTQKGLSESMLRYGYLDNQQQIVEFAENDSVESTKAIIKKEWMDTKRKNSLR